MTLLFSSFPTMVSSLGNYGLVEKTQNTFQDCLTHVPFIIKPPKGTQIQPGVREALVELVDMRATVEDID